MNQVLLVAAGGAVGAAARYVVNLAALRAFGPNFPVGTMIVNILGSLLMGMFIAYLSIRLSGSEAYRLLVTTGFLGGFTTFSAFALDFATLWERGEAFSAVVYALLSVLLSIGALFAGLAFVRSVA